MGKDSRKRYFRNRDLAIRRQQSQEEQEAHQRFQDLLTAALDQTAYFFTEVSRLQDEITNLSSSSSNTIRLWQARYNRLQESYQLLRQQADTSRRNFTRDIQGYINRERSLNREWDRLSIQFIQLRNRLNSVDAALLSRSIEYNFPYISRRFSRFN